MKLGYIMSRNRGVADRYLSDLAARLQQEGLTVAGLIQTRAPSDGDHPCDMDLVALPHGPQITIAQELGAVSHGCRLDPAALENASELVRQALVDGADVMILNKFGSQESAGRGFCTVIQTALERDVPVLTAVNAVNLDGFLAFTDGLETLLDPETDNIDGWLTDKTLD